jgi:hypothetical protein
MSFKCGSKLYSIKLNAYFDIFTQWKNYIPSVAKLAFEARRKNFTQFVVAPPPPPPPCNYFIHYFFLSKFIRQSSVHLNILILMKRMETQPKNLISQKLLLQKKTDLTWKTKNIFWSTSSSSSFVLMSYIHI